MWGDLGFGKMNATIQRRLLINYRVDPEVANAWLPEGLRPQLVDDSAIAGICLIRLAHMAPTWLPGQRGWGAENAAQRIAVERDVADGVERGVFIPLRYSASRVAVALGGRLFPGVHARADITSRESADRIEVTMRHRRTTLVHADVRVADVLAGSVFGSVEHASEFFRCGSLGWSPGRSRGSYDGLRLDTDAWRVEPTEPIDVGVRFFDELPSGTAELDSVLLMRNIPAVWTPSPTLHLRSVG